MGEAEGMASRGCGRGGGHGGTPLFRAGVVFEFKQRLGGLQAGFLNSAFCNLYRNAKGFCAISPFNQAGVDCHGKACVGARLKIKRGNEGRRSLPCWGVGGGSAPPTPFLLFAHLLSLLLITESSDCFSFLHPFFPKLLPCASRGIPGYWVLRYPEPAHYCRLSENSRTPPLSCSLLPPS